MKRLSVKQVFNDCFDRNRLKYLGTFTSQFSFVNLRRGKKLKMYRFENCDGFWWSPRHTVLMIMEHYGLELKELIG